MTSEAIQELDSRLLDKVQWRRAFNEQGRVRRMIGQSIELLGSSIGVGELCQIEVGADWVPAQVVGFSDTTSFAMPLGDLFGLMPGARVMPLKQLGEPESNDLLGKVVDALGNSFIATETIRRRATVERPMINPMQRANIEDELDVGIRAINGLFTIGIGQRVGLFAGSGVGKSALLGMMARFTKADIVVVGLVGERGREVREFVEKNLAHVRHKTVVIASPADAPPVLRLRAASFATKVAEDFRAQGKKVLLLIDSLTRVAQAQREIGLSIGEPPTAKGYPPSVFSLLPKLVERAGNLAGVNGSITGIYTVLVEEDDLQDPVVDATRAILDGHIVLSRALADSGHFPAIDVTASLSRVMPELVDREHQQLAQNFRKTWARYHHQEDLINVGAYVSGSDPLTDEAIKCHPKMVEFLTQGLDDQAGIGESLAQLQKSLQTHINKENGLTPCENLD